MLNQEQKIAFLEKEYFHLQTLVESFDAKSLTIKAWSVSLAVAVLSSGAFSKSIEVLLYAALASFLFWFIEAYWKAFQNANYQRIVEIEDYLSGKTDAIKTPQIGTSWFNGYSEGGRKQFYSILFWPHVVLPHGIMFIGFLTYYLVLKL